ncbi:MAG: hypothetical protein VYB71_00050 [Chloroflexota bacterium]|nr:hypothetical protein [Chloroflexota bacterium]MEE2655967.1 hypothetical protein [Chloroflexota bacterium]
MPRLMEACTRIGAHPAAFLFVSLTMVIVVAACSGSASIATSGVPAAKATPSEPPNLNGIVAGSEILVGDQRLPFGLFDFDGNPVEGADVGVEIYKLHQNGSLIPVSSADATFQEVHGIKRIHQHADGSNHDHQEVRGVYIIESVPFAEAGIWEAHLSVSGPNVSGTQRATLTFQVKDQSKTFAIGDIPPPSQNSTVRDVTSLEEITTLDPIVPGLYELTVAEALEGSKPFVVIFSTPAFCVTEMCGPVLDVAVKVYADYQDRVEFIHIEPWDLPAIRNEGKLVPTSITTEWRLPTEPWTFVVGKDNRITARWESLVTPEELTAALDSVLQ